MARADILVANTIGSETYLGAATKYVVETSAGVLYYFYINSAFDLFYRKSTNNGFTWSQPVTVKTGTVEGFALYADWWAGIAATKIRIWYMDSGVNDVLYKELETATDTLGTERTVFAGATLVITGSHLTGCVARSGYLFCHACIDAGVEGGFFRSTDDGVTWASVPPALNEALATTDQVIALPGWNADTNDIQLIFWDASASEVSVQRYDNSADTWSEASLSTGMTLSAATTAGLHFSAAADLASSRNVVIAWNGVDTANQDLKCWTVDDTTVTAKTDVVTNGTDDQGLAALCIDASGNWTAFYAGKSDGSETWASAVRIYQKVSSDSGTTWGAETLVGTYTLTAPYTQTLRSLFSIPKAYTQTGGDNPVGYVETTTPDSVRINVVLPSGGAASGVRNPLVGPIG